MNKSNNNNNNNNDNNHLDKGFLVKRGPYNPFQEILEK